MITEEHLTKIASWAGSLSDEEFDRARRGITERTYGEGAYVWHRGDRFEGWTGVVHGLVKVSTVAKSGKAMTFAGIRTGGWFGEGTVLKNEARQYDLVALRETRLAIMNRTTFTWLIDNSVGFNRFLVSLLNERLGQFMALVENDRTMEAQARLARALGWLCNPVLYPRAGADLEITQEELGLLCNLSRQKTNEVLKVLEQERLVRLDHGIIRALDPKALARYGDDETQ